MIDPTGPRSQHNFSPPSPIPGIIFRLAKTTDLKTLHDNCYPETDWEKFQDHYGYLLKWQKDGRCTVLVVETTIYSPVIRTDNSIRILPNRNTYSPGIIGSGQLIGQRDTAEIAELIVCAAYRNRGIGTAMIHILTQIAQKKKTKVLEIGVAAENQAALRLYRRLGFGDEHTLRLPGSEDAIILRKYFTPKDQGVETPRNSDEYYPD
jgi:ribosomal protein S18 acetylase RimI-like enzyme